MLRTFIKSQNFAPDSFLHVQVTRQIHIMVTVYDEQWYLRNIRNPHGFAQQATSFTTPKTSMSMCATVVLYAELELM